VSEHTEILRRLEDDLLVCGTAIIKTNADGTTERVAPEDFYHAADESRCRWPTCDCYSPQGPHVCRRFFRSLDQGERG
jgi:hypothetical protein